MTTTATRTGHRGASAGVLAIGGAAVAIATWTSEHGLAFGLLAMYTVAAVIACLWLSRVFAQPRRAALPAVAISREGTSRVGPIA